MKNYLFPAGGIIVVTIILLLVNRFTDSSIIQDYALIWIISGMFLGTGLAKWKGKSKSDD